MKIEKLFEVLKHLDTNKALKKKLKIFVVVGMFGSILVGGLAIWLGYKAFNFVATKTNDIAPTSIVKVSSDNLNSELTRLSKLQTVSCWEKVQSLIAVGIWLDRSALDNLIDLKEACWDKNLTAAHKVDVLEKKIINKRGKI